MRSPEPYQHPESEGSAAPALPDSVTRRAALRGLGGLGLGSILLMQQPEVAFAQASAAAAGALPSAATRDEFWTRDRSIWVRRTSTGEVIRSTYWSRGQLIQSEYERLCWFARDTTLERLMRENSPLIGRALNAGQQVSQWTMMNPIIFDVHYAITSWLSWFNMARPIEWTSAFRHPITNSITEGAARDSWHMRGGAIDARIPGVPIEQFGRFAEWLGAGGVGVYVNRSFTHTDSGRVRAWRS